MWIFAYMPRSAQLPKLDLKLLDYIQHSASIRDLAKNFRMVGMVPQTKKRNDSSINKIPKQLQKLCVKKKRTLKF